MVDMAASSPALTWRDKLRDYWRDPSIRIPILVFIAARVLTFVIAMTAVGVGPVHNVYANDTIFVQSMTGRLVNSPIAPFIEPWHRWDTGWYLKIALNGYAANDGSVIFAPLYPALIKVVGALTGDILLGALIVGNVACLALLIILYKLIQLQTQSNRIATNALLLLITFPTAFYLLAAYTESTFLLFVVGTFLAARQRHWWIAAILAALATLTRLQGWVLFFPVG
jgi:Gpi18-like mannosyltransferase